MPDLNPYASPILVDSEVPPGSEPRLGNVVANTMRVLFAQWTTILVALILICFPWELFHSYLTRNWLTYDHVWTAFFIGAAGQATLVLFAQALVMAAASLQLRAQHTGLTTTVAHAVSSFPTLFLCFVLALFPVMAGCLLLVIPGVYLNVRLMYYGCVAVSEDQSGVRPLLRSWELTNTHFLFSLTVFALFGLLVFVVWVTLIVLLSASETLQHWVLSAAVNTVSHFTTLLVCIGFTCSYHELLEFRAISPGGEFDS